MSDDRSFYTNYMFLGTPFLSILSIYIPPYLIENISQLDSPDTFVLIIRDIFATGIFFLLIYTLWEKFVRITLWGHLHSEQNYNGTWEGKCTIKAKYPPDENFKEKM